MSKELAKTYDPKAIEEKLYEKWCENKYFHAEVDRSRKPFTTVMPPPNITGKLHMGHALDNTLQDILIRYKRMEGYNALWIPGTDHAAISTEVKVTNQLKEEGIDKKELGREGFLERTWQWKEEYAGTIENQLKKLGISCDWDRERFTMDEGCSKAVEEVFIKLYEKGYIYKGSRIINWCPKCKTSLSDAEVEHEEQEGHFWHIKYPIVGSDDYLEIATTRPETMLGDTAIAVLNVNPGSQAILCGGQGGDEPCTEAAAMQDYMVAHGADAERLILENKSSTTIQNIANAKKLLPEGAAVAVITNDYHLARARRLLAHAGLGDAGVPAKTPYPGQWMAVRCREYCSIMGLMFTGRW